MATACRILIITGVTGTLREDLASRLKNFSSADGQIIVQSSRLCLPALRQQIGSYPRITYFAKYSYAITAEGRTTYGRLVDDPQYMISVADDEERGADSTPDTKYLPDQVDHDTTTDMPAQWMKVMTALGMAGGMVQYTYGGIVSISDGNSAPAPVDTSPMEIRSDSVTDFITKMQVGMMYSVKYHPKVSVDAPADRSCCAS